MAENTVGKKEIYIFVSILTLMAFGFGLMLGESIGLRSEDSRYITDYKRTVIAQKKLLQKHTKLILFAIKNDTTGAVADTAKKLGFEIKL